MTDRADVFGISVSLHFWKTWDRMLSAVDDSLPGHSTERRS